MLRAADDSLLFKLAKFIRMHSMCHTGGPFQFVISHTFRSEMANNQRLPLASDHTKCVLEIGVRASVDHLTHERRRMSLPSCSAQPERIGI